MAANVAQRHRLEYLGFASGHLYSFSSIGLPSASRHCKTSIANSLRISSVPARCSGSACFPLHCRSLRIFRLDPMRRAARAVARPFKAQLARVLEHRRAVLLNMLVEANARRRTAFARNNFSEALAAFRETDVIARELTSKDPANLRYWDDLAASLEYMGDVLRAQGEVAGATVHYREGLDIRRNLAAKDQSNIKWQTNIVLLLVRLGWIGDDARERFREALTILRPLNAQGRLLQAQQDG
jgi:tetratricopeptide (TPR) repeat protein